MKSVYRYCFIVASGFLFLTLNGFDLVGLYLNNVVNISFQKELQKLAAEPEFPTCIQRIKLPKTSWLLKKSLNITPFNERLLTISGRVAWLEGRCDEAVVSWGQAVRLSPNNPINWLWYVTSDETASSFMEISVGKEKAAYIYYTIGSWNREQDYWKETAFWFERANALVPKVEWANRIEYAYRKLGEPEAAVESWLQVVQASPDKNADYWWAKAKTAELLSNWKKAALYYGNGAQVSPEPFTFYLRQAMAYEHLERWDLSAQTYESALNLRPEALKPYLGFGYAKQMQGDFDGALRWYQQAEVLFPNRFEPKYWIGVVYFQKQDCDAAFNYFRMALEKQDEHTWSAYYLAHCTYQAGEIETAVQWMGFAIEWNSGQPWGWAVQLGDWLSEAGKFSEALNAYRLALKWNPNDETIESKITAITKP